MTGSDEKSESTVLLSANKEVVDPVNVKELAGLRHQVALLAETLEKMRLAEYIAYLNRPGRLLWFNFWSVLCEDWEQRWELDSSQELLISC